MRLASGNRRYNLGRWITQIFMLGWNFGCPAASGDVTDRGIRTIIAIRIDSLEITISEAGSNHSRRLLREEAERDGWFNGPPYAVAEHVFDEYDFDACALRREEF